MQCDSINITLEQHSHSAMVRHNLWNLLVLVMQLFVYYYLFLFFFMGGQIVINIMHMLCLHTHF